MYRIGNSFYKIKFANELCVGHFVVGTHSTISLIKEVGGLCFWKCGSKGYVSRPNDMLLVHLHPKNLTTGLRYTSSDVKSTDCFDDDIDHLNAIDVDGNSTTLPYFTRGCSGRITHIEPMDGVYAIVVEEVFDTSYTGRETKSTYGLLSPENYREGK